MEPHFRKSMKGAQHPLEAVVRVAAVEATASRRGKGRDGENTGGEGTESSPLSLVASLARSHSSCEKFRAVGRILVISHKNSVSHAGYICGI